MIGIIQRRRSLQDRLLFFAASSVIAAEVLFLFLVGSSVNMMGGTRLHELLEFDGMRPFVTRQFVPQAVRIVEAAVPFALRKRIEGSAWTAPVIGVLLGRFYWRGETRQFNTGRGLDYPETHEIDSATEALVCFVVFYCCIIGFAYAMRALLRSIRGDNHARIAALLAPALPIFLSPGDGTVYDFATLFLWAACLAALARGELRLYLLLYALSCTNRETTILLAAVFAWTSWETMPRVRLVGLVAIQTVLAIGIKGLIESMVVIPPASDLLMYHLSRQLSAAALPYQWPAIAVVLVVTVAAALSRNRLIEAGSFVAPVMLVAYFVFGDVGEYRTMFEAVPLSFAAICVAIAHPNSKSEAFTPSRDTSTSFRAFRREM